MGSKGAMHLNSLSRDRVLNGRVDHVNHVSLGAGFEAQAHVEEILTALEAHTLDGTDEPLRVYLTCVQVLAAHDDPRAPAALEAACADSRR
jgi:hypothetical protein